MKSASLSERQYILYTKDEFFDALKLDKSWNVHDADRAIMSSGEECISLVLDRSSVVK